MAGPDLCLRKPVLAALEGRRNADSRQSSQGLLQWTGQGLKEALETGEQAEALRRGRAGVREPGLHPSPLGLGSFLAPRRRPPSHSSPETGAHLQAHAGCVVLAPCASTAWNHQKGLVCSGLQVQPGRSAG